MVTMQNRLQRLMDTVLNPQGRPIAKDRPESTFIKIHQDRKKGTDENLPARGKPVTLAPRPATLDGKTVYLVDETFGGGYEFLKQMQEWFSRNMPAVKTVLRRKKGNMFVDDPELWFEVKERGDAVVLGVGG